MSIILLVLGIKIKTVGFFFLIFLFNSCANKSDRNFIRQNIGKIEDFFSINQKTARKFKVRNGTLKKGKVKKNSIKQRQVAVSTALTSNKKKKKLKKFRYPAGYPSSFKKYDQNSGFSWKKFHPRVYVNEEHVLEVSYLGVVAGYVKLVSKSIVNIGGKDVYHFQAHLRSARFYSSIYSVDDNIDSYVSIDNFLPIKYIQFQRESGQHVDQVQLFDHENLITHFWYKKLKKGRIKRDEKSIPIPRYFQDSFSTLYFLRGFPLNEGDKYSFPIISKAKIWVLNALVDKTEDISIAGKIIKAIRLKAVTRSPSALEDKGEFVIWYSADNFRKILKFQAKIKIGSIKGVLVEFRPGASSE